MYKILSKINEKPGVFSQYTAEKLWNTPHIAKQMLKFHLTEDVDAASRNKKFIDSSVKWLIDKFDIDETKTIIDFGCGPGLYALPLAKTGASVIGVDFSENSLEYAKNVANEEHIENIEYRQQNYLNYSGENQADLIIMIMCDFTALNPTQRKKMLEVAKKALKPNGKFIFDVYSKNHFEKQQEEQFYGLNIMQQFWGAADYYCFTNRFKYQEEKVILEKYTIFSQEETFDVYNWFQCFDKEMITKECEAAGLIVHEIIGNVAGIAFSDQENEFAIIVGK